MSWVRFLRLARRAAALWFLSAAPAQAATGLDWISTQQAFDGSYGNAAVSLATPFQSTAEVVRAQAMLGQATDPGIPLALLFLDATTQDDTEVLARKLVVAAHLGLPASPSLLTQVAANQAEDGGFGAGPGYDSSVFDTAAALEALSLTSDLAGSEAAGAVGYLVGRQQGSGGWSDGVNDPSVFLTAACVRALWPYRATYMGVDAALTRAQTFLLSRRGTDDLWGEDFLSSLALLALLPTAGDPSTLDASAAALAARQLADGSWVGDCYTTALALQALRLHEARKSDSAPPPTGAIAGYVVLAGSTERIAGALVSVDGSGVAAVTSAEGYYLLAGLPSGPHTVTATKAGFTSASMAATVETGKVVLGAALVLAPMPTTGLVVGKVFAAATGMPLPGVQVSLSGPASYSVLTDASGAFDFGAVEPNTYSLRFEKSGFLTVSGTAIVVAGQTLTAQLALTATGGWVDTSPGTVSGIVVDGGTGLAIGGALVDLGAGLSATTDASGAFSVSSVPRGTYQGTVTANGYRAVHFTLAFSPGASGAMGTVRLFPLASVTPPTTLTLRGTVVDGVTGVALPAATVSLVQLGLVASTGVDGRFVLSGISLQSFDLSLTATGYEPAKYGFQVTAFGEAEVTLKMPPVTAAPAATSTLAGLVTDGATGQPIAGAQVAIAGTSLSALTGSDGRYVLTGIDRLEFTIQVSAVGHLQRSWTAKLAAHGAYTLDAVLDPVAGASFQVVAVRAETPFSGANATALFTARIASLLPSAKAAWVLGEIQDATGAPVATVRPYAEGTTTLATEFAFDANEVKTLTVPWRTAQFPPGTYRLVLRVIEPGTITRAVPLGDVLAENFAPTDVVATLSIAGGVTLDPPLTQVGLPTPIAIGALLQNDGNAPISAGTYDVTVLHPDTGATLFTAQASAPALAVGDRAPLAFGSWVPTDMGNLKVTVRASEPGVVGTLLGTLYVGDKASGTFTVDRTEVPEGNSAVHAAINMRGVDVSQARTTDPLFVLVKESVRKGGVYTAAESRAWDQRFRCLGCHIHSQSLLGLESSVGKAEIDAAAVRYLHNVTVTSQRANGVLRNQYPTYPKTQTTLGLWSLGASHDSANFRVKYRAAQYLQTVKISAGGNTYWTADNPVAWWGSPDGHTALTMMGYADVLRDAARIDPSSVEDFKLGRAVSYGAVNWQAMTAAPDGTIHVATSSGAVIRVDPVTGAATTVITGLPVNAVRGLSVAADGTTWVTSSAFPAIIRIAPDGTKKSFNPNLVPGDSAIGPDGLLYVLDPSGKRILRFTAAEQIETFVTSSLFNSPSGLAFDATGNLLVANQGAFNILRVGVDKTVSLFTEELAFQPQRLAVATDGSLYVTVAWPELNGGVLRVFPDGRAVPVIQQEGLLGVTVVGSQVWVADTRNTVHTLNLLGTQALDTSGLPALKAELQAAARYLLSRVNDGSAVNAVQGLRLVGLSEVREFVDDATKAQIDSAVATIASLLRSRQRADGGWMVQNYLYYLYSDPLTTALVGIALEYTNPSPDDPQIRKAIEYLLNTQRPDGSWNNYYNGLSTRLGSTSFVMVFMPKALERLGGIDIDLHLELPASVQLASPSIAPSTAQPGADGSTSYTWQLTGVTSAGRTVEFDANLLAMALGESRPVATRAYLEFKNSFVDGRVQLPLEIPVVKTAIEMTIAVATDKPEYQANEPVAATATVQNVGPTIAAGQVQFEIRAPGRTTPVAVLPAAPFADLAPGASMPLLQSWNTGTQLAGAYSVHANLLDAKGRVVAQADAPFQIRPPVAVGAVSVATDKPVYDAWDDVALTVHVQNVALNAILARSRVEVEVRTPAGAPLLAASRENVQLMPGGVLTLPFDLALAGAADGTYPVTVNLLDAYTRAPLATATTSFGVVRTSLVSVAGSVTVDAPLLYAGDPGRCTDVAWNAAGTLLPGVTLVHRLVNVDTGTVISEATEVVDLPAGAQQYVVERPFVTASLTPGGYACVLDAALGAETRTLGWAGFQVMEAPVRVSATLGIGGRGRLLVLLDAARPDHDDEDADERGDHDRDPHGPDVLPTLAAQRAFLETLLTQGGWSYTITENAPDFARELRTGGYIEYALLSEHVKLPHAVEKELREAVFRGEGLLVAGGHDERNHHLREPLGIAFRGHHSGAAGVILSSAQHPEVAGQFGLVGHDHPERIRRVSAASLGQYQLGAGDREDDDSCGADDHDGKADRESGAGEEEDEDEPDDDCRNGPASPPYDAVTLNAYGRGSAAFAGFDLLAVATRGGKVSVPARTLTDLLSLVHPATFALSTSSVVPVELKVTNEGIAVAVEATVTLPAGAAIVDPGPATGVLDDRTLVFSFDLPADGVQVVRFWMRLPATPGPAVLQAQVKAKGGSVTTTVTTTATLSVEPAPELTTLWAELDRLARSEHRKGPIGRAAHHVEEGIESHSTDKAIHEVLEATDDLADVGDPAVVELRVGLDRWLRRAAMGTH